MLGLAIALQLTVAGRQLEAHDSLSGDRVTGRLGARLDSLLTRFSDYGFWGTVLVAKGGRVVLVKGYGLADATPGSQVRNGAAVRYEMNSLTKTFTGAAILRLEADGLLDHRDSVEKYLGDFPPAKRGATIDQLATHTSGLIVEGSQLAEASRDAFVQSVRETPREAAPGEQFRYTNAGFSLLAAIVERVSGESYESYVRRHLFEPAGMRSAGFRNDPPLHDSFDARGYVGSPERLMPGPPNPYVWGTVGAGGVWATIGDMYRWLLALEERRIVPEAQHRMMFVQRPSPREGYGWHAGITNDGKLLIQKGGGSDDFASHLLYYPRERVVVVWVSNNLRQRWRGTLNKAIPALIFGAPSVSLPAVAVIGTDALVARTGRFVAGRDTIDVRATREYLYATTNSLGVPTNVMFYPQAHGAFTGFDPQTGALTRLRLVGTAGTGSGGLTLLVDLPEGKQVVAQRK